MADFGVIRRFADGAFTAVSYFANIRRVELPMDAGDPARRGWHDRAPENLARGFGGGHLARILYICSGVPRTQSRLAALVTERFLYYATGFGAGPDDRGALPDGGCVRPARVFAADPNPES